VRGGTKTTVESWADLFKKGTPQKKATPPVTTPQPVSKAKATLKILGRKPLKLISGTVMYNSTSNKFDWRPSQSLIAGTAPKWVKGF
jgi:hypothetical protein